MVIEMGQEEGMTQAVNQIDGLLPPAPDAAGDPRVRSRGSPRAAHAQRSVRGAGKTLGGGRRHVRNLRGVTSIDELLDEARAFLDATSSPATRPTRSSCGARAPTG